MFFFIATLITVGLAFVVSDVFMRLSAFVKLEHVLAGMFIIVFALAVGALLKWLGAAREEA